MDKALLSLSLDDEDDQPLIIPNLPNFSSTHRNELSLIGKILNPKRQNIRNLLRDMPRKWQKVGRVTGVVLADERFQFIFKHRHDLEEVLEKGVHTYNDWCIVLDRWCPSPPEDFLQYIPVWVQIWNVPLDYRTIDTLKFIADPLGRILEVPFDPDKTQLQQYFRILIRFNVNNPLKGHRTIMLNDGSTTRITFKYERIQKRCIICHRLTHKMANCPQYQQTLPSNKDKDQPEASKPLPPNIPASDPLYGVISEDQAGLDPNNGRPKIASEVLNSLREYLLAAPNEDKPIITDQIKQAMKALDKNSEAKKSLLQLEPPPTIHKDINKGKGIVFEYNKPEAVSPPVPKLMAGAFKPNDPKPHNQQTSELFNYIPPEQLFIFGAHSPAGINLPPSILGESTSTSSSRVKQNRTSTRKPRHVSNRNKTSATKSNQSVSMSRDKRKAENDGISTASTKKLAPSQVIPKEGSPKQ